MGFLVYWVQQNGQVYYPVKKISKDEDGNLIEEMAYATDSMALAEAYKLFDNFRLNFPEREFFVLPV